MSELTENSHLQSNITMPVIRGEIALIVIILINSLILSILVDTFISKISLTMQPGPKIDSISGA